MSAKEMFDYLPALPAPGALTAGVPTAGGSVDPGTHSYKVTFVSTGSGETEAGTKSNVITAVLTTGQTVPLTAIPIGPAGTASRKIYRTIAGDGGSHLLLTTIADNATTTYSDTTADAGLGAAAPSTNTTGLLADADYTLGYTPYEIHPQGVIVEIGTKNQVVHKGDDGSEERISLSDTSEFTVHLNWDTLTASESGTLMDFWHNAAIGNGIQRSWKWKHPDDGHAYVVRWDCDFPRTRKAYDVYGVMDITLAVLGRVYE